MKPNLSTSHQAEAMKDARKSGVFFSSGGIDELMRKLAAPLLANVPIPRIYDPTCGRGYLLNAFADLPGAVLIGNDIDPMNTDFLQRGEAGFSCVVHTGDGLTYRPKEGVHLVVMNPPFSLKWDRITASPDLARRWTMPPDKAADWAFILNAFEGLARDGLLLSIVFPGCLYRGHKERDIRGELLAAGYVQAVVSLPAGLFEGTSIAVSLLILSRQRTDAVRFVDASQCCQKESKGNQLTGVGIEAIAATLLGENTGLPCASVSCCDIMENDCNLSPSAYIQRPDTRETIDIESVEAELAELKRKRRAVEDELDQFVEKLKAQLCT